MILLKINKGSIAQNDNDMEQLGLDKLIENKLKKLKIKSSSWEPQYLGWLEYAITEFKTVSFLFSEEHFREKRTLHIHQDEFKMEADIWTVELSFDIEGNSVYRYDVHNEFSTLENLTTNEAIKILDYTLGNLHEIFDDSYSTGTVRFDVQDDNISLRIGYDELRSGKYNNILEIMLGKVNPITRVKKAAESIC